MAISPRKLAANQENARRSTGPRTPEGKARVRHNALKHGLLAKEVIVPVGDEQERREEFDLLLDNLWRDHAPVGRIEEMFVEMIAVAYWRLRRATRAEVGELGLEFAKTAGSGAVRARIIAKMQKEVEAADPNADFGAWLQSEGNKTLLSGGVAKKVLNWDIEKAVAHINQLAPAQRKQWLLEGLEYARQEHLEEERQEEAQAYRQALRAKQSLPETVDKILRYQTTIERQLFRAFTALEKLQAARRRTPSPASGPTRAA